MKRYWDMLISVGLGLVLAALIVVGYIAYESTTHLIESNRQVTTTHRVLENLTLLRLELQNAETAQRSFLVTGKDHNLGPYVANRDNITKHTVMLRKFAVDDPSQVSALDALEPLLADRLADLQEGIDARRAKGPRSASDLVLAERGKRINDQIHTAIAGMEARYNTLLVRQSTEADRIAGLATWIIVCESMLAFVVVTLSGIVWLARRSAKRAAEQAEAKFREIFENSAEGIYQCTPTGQFLTVNPAMARPRANTVAPGWG